MSAGRAIDDNDGIMVTTAAAVFSAVASIDETVRSEEAEEGIYSESCRGVKEKRGGGFQGGWEGRERANERALRKQ